MATHVLLVSSGDANNIDTWSNVPYFLLQTMKKKGYRVDTVNIGTKTKLETFFTKAVNKVLRLILREGSLYSVQYYPWYKAWKEKAVKRALREHPDIDVIVYVCAVPYARPNTQTRAVLVFDFNIEYTLRTLLGREPTKREAVFMRQEDCAISQMQNIFVLFQDAAEHFKKYYHTDRFIVLNGHMINAVDMQYDQAEAYRAKMFSNEILFIGRIRYADGLRSAIRAIEIYNDYHKNAQVKLNIIGVTAQQLDVPLPCVECKGYLSKNNKEEREEYYRLIGNAKAIINTTKNWGGISAIVEAMWFGTPVITTRYAEFVRLFGEEISFGYYCAPEDDIALAYEIEKIFALEKSAYQAMSDAAHDAVKDFTWDAFVEQLMQPF